MIQKVKNRYWKIHKNNIKNYFDEKINIYISEKWLDYVRYDYIYVGTFINSMGDFNYGWMYFTEKSEEYFKNENYTYEGEFLPIKQQRKEKLIKLNESRR